MHRKSTSSRKNKYDTLDDGGAAKGSSRFYRRRRRRILKLIKIPLICISILLLTIYRKDIVTKTKEEVSNVRKEFHEKYHMGVSLFALGRESVGQIKTEKDEQKETDQSSYPRWTKDSILPPAHGDIRPWYEKYLKAEKRVRVGPSIFKAKHPEKLPWEEEMEDDGFTLKPPIIDYTRHSYEYPELVPYPERGGAYPDFDTLGNILSNWSQDDIDSPPTPFKERLQHFDYTDPVQMEMARRYRDAQFPFKLTNVPDIIAAGEKWTDEYLIYNFDYVGKQIRQYDPRYKKLREKYGPAQLSTGHCQESVDSFFAFFTARNWRFSSMGTPPTKDNDFSFERWSNHAKYADTVRLKPSEVHYYWQSGVNESELKGKETRWSMIATDLPSFSDTDPNFISFNPSERKGIQCRFGERGVAAATHYDGGKNMVGMITGAKRYILAPPIECSKLGIITHKKHPTFRHSLLNFDHINLLESKESESMPANEREWLELSKGSLAIDTIIKAGEILYIPSHWFHYIISLQKSAQCNVRSGRDLEGSEEWGNWEDVRTCVGNSDEE
jgi:hypothetical protein